MKTLSLITILALFILTGCATPGNLQTDLARIDAALAGKQQASPLAIEFTDPAGVVSGSTEMFAGGAYIKGSKQLDTKQFAEEAATLVFGKLFSDAKLATTRAPAASTLYLIRLQAESGISEWNGTHSATLSAQFYGPGNDLLIQTQVRHVVDHIQYAQEAPMRRAYLRAFTDLALQIHDRLVGAADSSRTQHQELMSTARSIK